MNNNKNLNKLIALLFVSVLMGALDISIVGPAIPSIEKTLKIDTLYIGWIFSIYILFNLMGLSLFARLSDIYGRRNIYVIALSIFGIGSLIVSLSNNFILLLVGRAIQGFGASGIFPVASAVIGDIFPPEKRGKMLGIIGAVFGLAFMVGPFIAGIMLHYFEWNSLFIINIPIILILIFYSLKIMPNQTALTVSKIDWKGIIFLGIGLVFFTLGLNNFTFENLSMFIFQSGLPLFMALILFTALIITEKKAEAPIIKISFLKNNQIIYAGILAIVTGLVQSVFVFLPKFAVDTFHVSSSSASFMLIPIVLATAIGSPFFGQMIDKHGVKPIISIGLGFLLVGFFLLYSIGNSKVLFYSGGFSIGLGLSVLSGSSLRYIMLNNTDIDDRAISQGMITMFTSIGQIAGSAIVGILLSFKSNSYSIMFLGLSIILGSTALSVLLKFRNEAKRK